MIGKHLGCGTIAVLSSFGENNLDVTKTLSKYAPMAKALNGYTNGTTTTTLKATAPSFHPTGTPDPSQYHSASTGEALHSERTYAAHNYHPLPIVFARASGTSVWDPEGKEVCASLVFGIRKEDKDSLLPVSRFFICIQCGQPRTLPSRASKSIDGAGISANIELKSVL